MYTMLETKSLKSFFQSNLLPILNFNSKLQFVATSISNRSDGKILKEKNIEQVSLKKSF